MKKIIGEYSVDMDGINNMYSKLYWGQIMSLKTPLSVKWLAIKSLWIMRSIK